MKIALLNLPLDNNYGGNLQRYALTKTLQGMGHDVVHINLRFSVRPSWPRMILRIPFRLLNKFLGRRTPILREWYDYRAWKGLLRLTEPFYEKHIPHTKAVLRLTDYKKYGDYDAVLVGSDQVWRKNIAHEHLSNLFMDFLPADSKQRRIAYGVSLGTEKNELTEQEIGRLRELYNRFDAVSVREASALTLFEKYGWTSPKAIQVLDPTLLLTAADYETLMPQPSTSTELFCYVLDMTDEKKALIERQAAEQGLAPVLASINYRANITIEQWLSNFYNAKSVVTDSFHGMLFSIIFHKPFIVIGNEFRGMGRFTSLLSYLGLSDRLLKETDLSAVPAMQPIHWTNVDEALDKLRGVSLDFLKQNLR